jgi:hypothetical protein
MAAPHTCSPAMRLPHRNRHSLKMSAIPSGHHSLPTIAYRSIGIRLLASSGLPHSTIDIPPHWLPNRPLSDSGPRTRVPSTNGRYSDRKQKSDSARDVPFARAGRCSIARIFHVPAGTVLPTSLLHLGSLLDVHDCSSCTIPAIARSYRSDCLATAAGRFGGLPRSRTSRTYPHHAV